MVELIEAVVSALTAAGLHASAAMPAVLSPRLHSPAIAVGVEELESAPGGFSSYLGMQDGHPVYGLRLHGKLRLDVLSPTAAGAAQCREAMDDAASVLAEGVESVSIYNLTAFEPEYDRADDCFRGKLLAQCRLWLCAGETEAEVGTVEHFILKGALQ